MNRYDFPILGIPQVKLDFLGPHGHRGPKGRHAVFRGNGTKAAMSTDSRIRHDAIGPDNRTAGRPVFPRSPSLFDIFIMRGIRIAEARGLIVFFCDIDIDSLQPNPAFHIEQHIPVWCHHHAGSAYIGMNIHADRRTQNIGVAVISQKARHDFKSGVRIASLMGASDNHIHAISGYVGKRLVKIEIIAGQKRISNPLDFEHRRLAELKAVVAVQTGFRHLVWGKVLLIIFASQCAVTVKRKSCISQSPSFITGRIDKHQGSASLGRSGSGFQNTRIIAGIIRFIVFF